MGLDLLSLLSGINKSEGEFTLHDGGNWYVSISLISLVCVGCWGIREVGTQADSFTQ